MKQLNVIILIVMMVVTTVGCVEKDKNQDVFDRSEEVSQNINPEKDNKKFMAYAAGYITKGEEEIIDKIYDIDDNDETVFILQLTKFNTSFHQLKEGTSAFVDDYEGVTYFKKWRTYRSQGRDLKGTSLQAKDVTFTFPDREDMYIPEALVTIIHWPDRIEFIVTYPSS